MEGGASRGLAANERRSSPNSSPFLFGADKADRPLKSQRRSLVPQVHSEAEVRQPVGHSRGALSVDAEVATTSQSHLHNTASATTAPTTSASISHGHHLHRAHARLHLLALALELVVHARFPGQRRVAGAERVVGQLALRAHLASAAIRSAH